jgi:DNA-directed RNA polymerase subunit M
MRFCDKCGNLLVVEKGRKITHIKCRKCGKEYKLHEKLTISEEKHDYKKGIVVMGKDEQQGDLPVTHIICPECENGEAFWWMQQTRSADEPPTLFYRCKKCGHGWRSYG